MRLGTGLVLAVCLACGLAEGAEAAEGVSAPATEVGKGLASFKPTLVTAKFSETPAMEALKQLGAQGNVTFKVWPDFKLKEIEGKKVSGEFSATPFWTAVLDVCRQIKMNPSGVSFEDKREIQLQQSDESESSLPMYVSGPVVIMAESIQYERELKYGSGKPTYKAEVRFRYLMDPALMSKDFGTVAVLSEMVDDQGQSLLRKKPEKEKWFSGSAGELVGSTFAHLEYLGQTGKVCKSLKGSIEGSFVLGTEKWELDVKQAKGQTKKVGPTTITITDVQTSDDSCKVMVNFKGPKSAKGESKLHEALVYSVVDAQGNKWRNQGSFGGGFATNLNYTYDFVQSDERKAGPAAKLVVEIPTGMVTDAVPFEFRDLALP